MMTSSTPDTPAWRPSGELAPHLAQRNGHAGHQDGQLGMNQPRRYRKNLGSAIRYEVHLSRVYRRTLAELQNLAKNCKTNLRIASPPWWHGPFSLCSQVIHS